MKTNCPVCYQALGYNKVSTSTVLCTSCGWKQDVAPLKRPQSNHLQMSIIKSMLISFVGLLLVILHFSKWGSDSINIVYLKSAQVLHFAGPRQYNKLFSICKKTQNHDCMESALKDHYQSSKDVNQLKKLALFQLQREKTKEAIHSYEQYFHITGRDNIDKQSAYNYAKLLDQVGQQEKALNYYGTILSQQQKDTIAVSVVRNTVHLLVRLNRQDEAMKLVQKYKNLDQEDDYLKQEINKWEQQVLNNS